MESMGSSTLSIGSTTALGVEDDANSFAMESTTTDRVSRLVLLFYGMRRKNLIYGCSRLS